MDDRPTPDRTRREGVLAAPIVLADGETWGLALPSARLRPLVERGVDTLGRPTETIRVAAEFGYPLAIRRLVDDLRDACEAGNADQQCQTLMTLASALIRRAHDVDSTTTASLLELEMVDLHKLVEAVVSVVTGVRPDSPATPGKAQTDG